MTEVSQGAELAESGRWRCDILVEDYEGEYVPGAEPIARTEFGNLLMNGGVSFLWQCAQGLGTATAGQALTYLTNTTAAIGAGNGTTAAAAGQTDLVGASRLRKGMNATYPQHTDGTVTGSKTITFQSTFGTTDANFDWQEIGVFNSTTDAVGRMLNRALQAIGVKSSAVSRVVTVTITIN